MVDTPSKRALPGDTAGRERLAQYMLRCPFSLQRMIRVTDQGKVLYCAEKRTCRRFPRPAARDLFNGVPTSPSGHPTDSDEPARLVSSPQGPARWPPAGCQSIVGNRRPTRARAP